MRPVLLLVALLGAGCASARAHLTVEPRPTEAAVGRLVLVGDAGLGIGEVADDLDPKAKAGACEAPGAEAMVEALAVSRVQVPILEPLREAIRESSSSVVIWLGDNVYERGIAADRTVGDFWSDEGPLRPGKKDDPEYPSFAALHAQVWASAGAGKAFFVPGNHDWDSRIGQNVDGPKRVAAQAAAIKELACRVALRESSRDIQLIPTGACPGPSVQDLSFQGVSVRVLAFDSEALLQTMAKGPPPGCPSDAAFFEALQQQAAAAPGLVLVAAHHPLTTYGPHGGYNGAGPLAWLQTAVRWIFRSNQDLRGGKNTLMRRKVREALAPSASKVLAYASGHEHSLQVIRHGSDGLWELGSGTASKSTPVRRGRWSQFASRSNGFMYIDFYAGGRAMLNILEADSARKTVTTARLR
jgi:hypothetical protein